MMCSACMTPRTLFCRSIPVWAGQYEVQSAFFHVESAQKLPFSRKSSQKGGKHLSIKLHPKPPNIYSSHLPCSKSARRIRKSSYHMTASLQKERKKKELWSHFRSDAPFWEKVLCNCSLHLFLSCQQCQQQFTLFTEGSL